ncbi:MAG: OprO/OprP family phosphate-selective porin [Planctomycetales bacterium]|nr:OprO/OprP family phosphate-selective porin [Planctomycetales bacterium]
MNWHTFLGSTARRFGAAALLGCGGLLTCAGNLWAEESDLRRLPTVEDVLTNSAESFETALADGETDLAKRLASVEAQLKKRDDADKKTAETAAKKFVVRPFGRIHIDTAAFNQSASNRATVGDARNGVDIRRARLGCEGEGFDIFFYRFDVDFVTFDQATQTRPVIVDAYLDTQALPYVGNIRAGHFREPFSLERLDSTSDLPFLERSAVVNALTPFRNVGLMGFNWNEAETATIAYGVFDENTNEFGEDDRDQTGIAGTCRGTWLPWYDEASGRGLFHVGGSYSYRHLGGNHLRRFAITPEVQLKEGLLFRTPNFVDTGLLSISNYHVAGAEFSLMLGSLALQGEYIIAAGDRTSGQNFFFQGGYVEAMYWLTGENQNYNRKLGIHGAVTPYSNFFRVRTDKGVETSWGAWEATARLSTLDLNDGNIHGGQMTDLTLGTNFYYAVRSRVMFNYIHSFLDRNNVNSNADIVAMRFQFTF